MKGKAGQGHQADISKINSAESVGSNSGKSAETTQLIFTQCRIKCIASGEVWPAGGIGPCGIQKREPWGIRFYCHQERPGERVLSLQMTNPVPLDRPDTQANSDDSLGHFSLMNASRRDHTNASFLIHSFSMC